MDEALGWSFLLRQKDDHNQGLQLISVHDTDRAGALGELSEFRQQLYDRLVRRTDTLFELADAVLCTPGPVASLAELFLTPEHRRGHGAGYDAINHGRIEIDRGQAQQQRPRARVQLRTHDPERCRSYRKTDVILT